MLLQKIGWVEAWIVQVQFEFATALSESRWTNTVTAVYLLYFIITGHNWGMNF